MNISTVSSLNIADNIERMNDMIMKISTAQMGLENKMMKINVISSVEGLGENLDVTV